MVAGRRTIVVTTVAGARPPLQPPIIPGFDDGHPVSAALLTDPPRASRSPQPERLDASQHHYGANGLPTDRLIAYPARYA